MFKGMQAFKKAMARLSGASSVRNVKPARKVVEFKPPYDARAELPALQAVAKNALETLIDATCFSSAPDFEAIARAATRLGFPEVADFDADKMTALCAAVRAEYADVYPHPSIATAIPAICYMVDHIRKGNYTLWKDVDTEEDIGCKLIRKWFDGHGTREPEFFWDFVDVEGLGEYYREQKEAVFTHLGLFHYGNAD